MHFLTNLCIIVLIQPTSWILMLKFKYKKSLEDCSFIGKMEKFELYSLLSVSWSSFNLFSLFPNLKLALRIWNSRIWNDECTIAFAKYIFFFVVSRFHQLLYILNTNKDIATLCECFSSMIVDTWFLRSKNMFCKTFHIFCSMSVFFFQ